MMTALRSNEARVVRTSIYAVLREAQKPRAGPLVMSLRNCQRY